MGASLQVNPKNLHVHGPGDRILLRTRSTYDVARGTAPARQARKPESTQKQGAGGKAARPALGWPPGVPTPHQVPATNGGRRSTRRGLRGTCVLACLLSEAVAAGRGRQGTAGDSQRRAAEPGEAPLCALGLTRAPGTGPHGSGGRGRTSQRAPRSPGRPEGSGRHARPAQRRNRERPRFTR